MSWEALLVVLAVVLAALLPVSTSQQLNVTVGVVGRPFRISIEYAANEMAIGFGRLPFLFPLDNLYQQFHSHHIKPRIANGNAIRPYQVGCRKIGAIKIICLIASIYCFLV
jgi:hypothetical protein